MAYPTRSLAVAAMLVLLGTALPSPLLAQRDAQADCQGVLRSLTKVAVAATAGCKQLATFLEDAVSTPTFMSLFKSRVSSDTALQPTPRKLQSMRSNEADVSGVPGQSQAAPTAQPTGLAAANVSAAGTDQGTSAIAAISINPLTLLGGTDTAAAAKWSRLTDLTVLIPVSSANGSPGRLGYFGLRGRLNLTGVSAGERLLSNVDSAFAKIITASTRLTERLKTALESLPDSATVARCAEAVMKASLGDTPDACLGKVTIGLNQADYEEAHRAVALAREKADARYFGLDLRFDHGDPTLARDPTKEVTALQAGLAFGRRILKPDPNAVTLGLQGRIGVRYSDPKISTDSVVWSLDGAVGLETSRLLSNDQPVRFTTGLEFRYGNKPDDVAERAQTDYLIVRGGLAVPLIGGTSVSLGFTGPLTGDVSPDLSVNFNWGLLMSSLNEASR